MILAAEPPAPHATDARWLPLEIPGDGEPGFADRVATPDQLAYAIFTSGSTGTPKAVGGTHGATLSLLRELERMSPLEPGSRCAWIASPAFDVSISEVFDVVCRGCRLLVCPEEV